MKDYQNLIRAISLYGNAKESRAGPIVGSFGFYRQFSLIDQFPAVTIKKLYFKSVANELAGFLRGETDANKMGSGIWKKDALRWSGGTDMGRVYGVQWRQWKGPQGEVDQLRQVVDRIKTDPNDRRLLVSAWNPGELHLGCLPPCHYAFQFYVHNDYLDCAFNMRSVDIILGLPFDIASYALLTYIVAQETKLKPGFLHAFLGDAHIYKNHLNIVSELLSREPFKPPKLKLDPKATIDNFTGKMATLMHYKHHPPVQAELNVGL